MFSQFVARLASPAVALLASLALLVAAVAPVAAQNAPVAAPAPATQPRAAQPRAAQADAAPLTADEEAGLLFMLEEEKLAHDLYVALDAVAASEGWALPIFTNIARAETVHSNAVLRLLTAYGVDAPAAALPAGEFLNADLQALYDTLLAQGSATRADALAVGALVEETDIADLDEHLATVEHAAISRVYTSLRRGSTHHLQAYTSLLERLDGVTYAPVVLDDDAYAAAKATERGGPQGQGGRRGH